jgi:ketosteroid isomerase-like protein
LKVPLGVVADCSAGRSGILQRVPQENVEIVRRLAEAIGRGDVATVLAEMHPEIVLEPHRSVTEGAFIGHDGLRAFMADTAETFELFVPELSDLRDLGDRVLVIGSIRLRGRGSGIEMTVPVAAIFELRDGLVVRFKDYVEPRIAFEAAGLDV